MAFSGFGRQTGPAGPPPRKFANPFNQFTRPPSPSPSPSPSLSTSPAPSPLPPSAPFSTSSSLIRSPRRPEYSQVLQSPSHSLRSTISSSYPPHPSFDVHSQLDFQPRSPVDYADSLIAEECHPFQNESQGRIRSPPAELENVGSQRNSNSLVGNRQVLVSRATRSPKIDHDNRHLPLQIDRSRESQRPTSTASRSLQRLPSNSEFSIAHQNQSSVLPRVGSFGDESSSPVKFVGYGEKQKMTSPSPVVIGVFRGNSRVKDMSISSSVSPSAANTKSDSISWPDLDVCWNASSAYGGGSETSSDKTGVFPVPKRTRSPTSPLMDQDLKQKSSFSHNEEEREMQAKAKRLARFKIELSEPVKSGPSFMNPKVSYSKEEPCMMEGVSSQRSVILPQDLPVDDILRDNEGPEPSNIIIGLCPDMCPESERAERERKGDLDQYERLDGDRNQTNKSLAVKKYNRTAEREAILIRPMPVLQKTILYLLNLLDQPYDERFLGIYNFLWDRMRAVRMDLRMQHIFNLESVKMLEQMIRLHIIAMHELCEYEKGEGFSEGFDAHLNIEQMNKTSAELFQLYDDHRKKGINVPTEKEFRGYYALLKLDKHPGYKVEPAELSLDLAKMTPEIRQTEEVRFARDVARACRTGNFIAFFRLARKASYLQACLMHAHFAKLRSQALASLHSGLQSNQGLPVAVIARWLAMEEEDIESLLEFYGFAIREYEEPYVVKEGPFLHRDYPTKCSKLVNTKKSLTIVEDVSPSKVEAFKPSLEARTTELENCIMQFAGNGSPINRVEEEMPDSVAFSLPKESNRRHLMLETTGGLQHRDVDHKMTSSSPKASSFMAGNCPWNFSVACSSPKAPRTNTTVLQHKDVDRKISGVRSSPWNVKAPQIYTVASQHEDVDHKISGVRSWWENIITSSPCTPHKNMVATPELLKSPETTTSSRIEMMPLQVSSGGIPVDTVPNDTGHAFKKALPLDENKSNSEKEEVREYHQANKIEEDLLENEDEELTEAKLKLIIRLWKRRASRLRDMRHQRQLAAANALNALSLGPRIGCKKELSSSSDTFDIDQIMRERYDKCEQSWSILNVADMAADGLIQKNPNARCLCWKVVFCSTMSTQQIEGLGPSCHVTHLAAARWLHAKLMPDQAQDDNLVLSLPGVSIWRKWVFGLFGTESTCLLSVMKDTSSNNFSEAVQGASAVIFLLFDGVPFEHQKIQLHNLLASLHSESCLPLLILSDSNKEDMSDASSIINNLGLHGIDRSRLRSFTVIHLVDRLIDSHEGFFSDHRLREGLQWLARESPPQPVLHCAHTRELVQNHLSSCLGIRGKGTSGVDPKHCISAFNKALEQSLELVAMAAKSNPNCWPCSEITLLDKSSIEYSIARAYLPSVGWSTESKISPIMSALRESKLPEIIDDFSWLTKGSKMGMEVERQRLQLEEFLVKYLSKTSNTLGYSLARNEASLMLQKYVGLQLHGSTYYIIPNWEMIFQRIYNWRLMNLSGEEASLSYILEQHLASESLVQDHMNYEMDASMYWNLENPSLDELLEVSCDLPSTATYSVQPEALKNSARTEDGGVQISKFVSIKETTSMSRRKFPQNGDVAERSDVTPTNSGSIIDSSTPDTSVKANSSSDKLSVLLGQCNMVQNIIEKKLSVYF